MGKRYHPSVKYTGKLLGVENLHHQSDLQLVISDKDLEHSIDEGFEDYEDAPFDQLPALTVDCPMVENPSTVVPPLDSKRVRMRKKMEVSRMMMKPSMHVASLNPPDGGASSKKGFLLSPKSQEDPHCFDLVHQVFRLFGKLCAK